VDDDVTITHLNTCKTKTLHGKSANLLQENHVDKESSLLWLSAGCIYAKTEGFPVAIQDQVIKTINYENHCLGVEVPNRCTKHKRVGKLMYK
jgi:hypothetical protein